MGQQNAEQKRATMARFVFPFCIACLICLICAPDALAADVPTEAPSSSAPLPVSPVAVPIGTASLAPSALLPKAEDQSLEQPRTKRPEALSPWYYSLSNPYFTSDSLAPTGNKVAGGSYTTGNCTWYAWGRAAEIIGHAPAFGARDPYGMWTAAQGVYETGPVPKAGSLVIFGQQGGLYHVAVVEKIEKGIVYVSESGYSTGSDKPEADTVIFHYGPMDDWSRGREVIGYIYLPIDSSVCVHAKFTQSGTSHAIDDMTHAMRVTCTCDRCGYSWSVKGESDDHHYVYAGADYRCQECGQRFCPHNGGVYDAVEATVLYRDAETSSEPLVDIPVNTPVRSTAGILGADGNWWGQVASAGQVGWIRFDAFIPHGTGGNHVYAEDGTCSFCGRSDAVIHEVGTYVTAKDNTPLHSAAYTAAGVCGALEQEGSPVSVVEVVKNINGDWWGLTTTSAFVDMQQLVAITAQDPLTRLVGADPVADASQVVRTGFQSADTVVVALADDPVASLVSSGFAGTLQAPILMAEKEGIAPSAAETIRSLGAKNAVVIDGGAAVPFGVEKSLVDLGLSVRHVGVAAQGASLPQTDSAQSSQDAPKAAGPSAAPTSPEKLSVALYDAGQGWGRAALVVNPSVASDLFSAAPLSYSLRAPLFLTAPDGSLTVETLDKIKSNFDEVIEIGREISVSAAVDSDLRASLGNSRITRLAGNDCYQTNALVAEAAVVRGVASYNGAVMVSAAAEDASRASIATSCGQRAVGMLLVDDTPAGHYALYNNLLKNKKLITTGVVCGGDSTISENFFKEIGAVIQ